MYRFSVCFRGCKRKLRRTTGTRRNIAEQWRWRGRRRREEEERDKRSRPDNVFTSTCTQEAGCFTLLTGGFSLIQRLSLILIHPHTRPSFTLSHAPTPFFSPLTLLPLYLFISFPPSPTRFRPLSPSFYPSTPLFHLPSTCLWIHSHPSATSPFHFSIFLSPRVISVTTNSFPFPVMLPRLLV